MSPEPHQIALTVIRDTLGLPSTASPSDVVNAVRKLKAERDALDGHLFKPRRTRKIRLPMDLGRVDG
jgi:hypothetical protein